MRPASQITTSLVFFLAFSLHAQTNTPDAIQTAQEEAVRRQAATQDMETTLQAADAARKRNEILNAAKLYQDAATNFDNLQVGNARVEEEKKAVLAGLDETRELLARAIHDAGRPGRRHRSSQRRPQVRSHQRKVCASSRRKLTCGRPLMRAMCPARRCSSRFLGIQKTNVQVATMVQNGRLLYEMGRLDEAETGPVAGPGH